MPKYDAVVVGAGLGGLAAAALLSSKKIKVIVLEHSKSRDRAMGIYGKDGYNSCSAPMLSYGLERGGAIDNLLVKLGIDHSASGQSPCYQVALPDHRITIYANQGETLEELRREFPKEIDSLAKFYRNLQSVANKITGSRFSACIAKRRSAAGFIGKYRFSRELTAFFDIQSLNFFQTSLAGLSLASLTTLCTNPILHLEGGFNKLADQLHGVILQHGGEVLYNQTVNEFALRGNRIIGITTKQGAMEADTILLNRAPHYEPSAILLGLPDTVIPVGMAREVLFLPDYRMPKDYFALSLSAKDDVASAPQGMRVLSMSFRSEKSYAIGKQVLIDRLNSLIPFLNEYIVFSDEHRAYDDEIALPAGVTFKPIRSSEGMPLLSRGSRKNVYLLENAQKYPLQVISAVNRFVQKVT